MTDYTIRNASDDDIPLLATLIRTSFRDVAERFGLTAENCPKHPSNCTVDWIGHDLARGRRYFVLEETDGICGCAALEKAGAEDCYLERLAVLPEKRRRGLGQALVEKVIAEARGLGAARVGIGIIAHQNELKRWYEKLGFIEGDTRTFAHLPFEVMFMSRALI
ncbi:MAG: GNAT family N-acetyltransferase [Deltaproteobacteria bacterium]|nr:GNAT family N-acetyltransferase [Deltaproteobacteria bacterium]